jgi:hypothetical protein
MSDLEFPWLVFIPMLAMFALVVALMFRKSRGWDRAGRGLGGAGQWNDNTSMQSCPSCGASVPSVARFCSQCGRKLDSSRSNL